VYRVLGGNRTTPCVGTRDDDARARTNAEHLVIRRFGAGSGPTTNTVGGNGPRPPTKWRAPIVASVKIKPLEDKILVQANEAETTTASGLVIPDTAKEKPQEGTVVAVGPGRWDEDGEKRIPLDVSEGDTVIYSKYGGTEIKYNGEEYLILSARDVLAVVSK
jgi:chaperonin GroES